jgi:hypothetical protein
MTWVSHRVLTVAVVAVALTVTGGIFAFARPSYHPARRSYTVNMTASPSYSVAQVVRAFAAHGISLFKSDTLASAIFLINTPNAHSPHALVVTRFRPSGTVGFVTHKNSRRSYEKRVGNVVVDFNAQDQSGGRDLSLGQRAAAALRDLG